ncbi:hypothetical protein T440DRAFT_522739 [Plenodomus tracheiphilus IPT5]|uniref:RING-type domain-containing protein n=1 Tax=Plenodomus tracheiphilus IPT5 TaxID=1408161 RepID=A0A6A7AQ06_9PLEO|nr:hypothetical protein T440DRAFT_522739 [Plenodomus tracheiphilus IPT5]
MRLLNSSNRDAPSHEQLPSQLDFLTNHIIRSSEECLVPDDGLECGVCLEDLVPVAQSIRPGSRLADPVVYLKPCAHFFHVLCIVRWHNSSRPERNTCPLCRRVLFVADPLTPTQIRLLHGDSRPLGPHRLPGPDEEIAPWEIYSRDMEASYAVSLEIDRVSVSGGDYRWMEVTKLVRDNIMVAGGRLRPEFVPHSDTSVLLAFAISVLWSVVRFPRTVESPAFVSFNLWIDALIEQQEDPDVYVDIHSHGLFDCNFLKVSTVPKMYRISRRAWASKALNLRAQLALARERERESGSLAAVVQAEKTG